MQFDLHPFAFFYSFDLFSLFTNVPLPETINIRADVLYGSDLIYLSFSVNYQLNSCKQRINLLTSVTTTLNTYKQIDSVAMGSSLGPALANIFIGYYESLLFRRIKTPPMYYRYVNDTLAILDCENDCNEFLHQLNSLHPSLRFTFKKEINQSLPSLDIQVEMVGPTLITSVYR